MTRPVLKRGPFNPESRALTNLCDILCSGCFGSGLHVKLNYFVFLSGGSVTAGLAIYDTMQVCLLQFLSNCITFVCLFRTKS